MNIYEDNPEFRTREAWAKYGIQTLTSLGFKESWEASSEGYICIRPYKSSGMRSYPGIWILPEGLELMKADLILLKQEHLQKERDAKNAKIIKQHSKLEKHYKKLAKLASIDISKISPEVRDKLDNLFVDTPLKVEISYFMLSIIKTLAPLYKGRSLNNKGQYKIDNIYLNANDEECLALLVKSEIDAFTQRMDFLLDNFDVNAEKLFNEWNATRPAWFNEKTLRGWCINKSRDSSIEDHPLLRHLPPGTKWASETQVNWRGETKLGLSINKLKTCSLMWETADLGGKDFKSVMATIGRKLMVEWLEGVRIKFFEKNPYQEEWNRLGLPPELYSMFGHSAIAYGVKFEFRISQNKTEKDYEVAVLKHAKTECARLVSEELKLFSIKQFRTKELPSKLEDFYPKARLMDRKLTFICGPTNSGKTYRALNRLTSAGSGAYLGPLRLLALEVRDDLVAQGIPVSLVTGELVEIDERASITSATIEMANYNHEIDVAVIDEIQMIADGQRGSAWLQAVLGIPASEVIMVGAPEAESIVVRLAEMLGEPLEIIRTERLNPLHVDEFPEKLQSVPDGSAVIAFSRKDILGIAAFLRDKGRKPVVVYGALPPDVRIEQARKFRTGEADVLVASDAIGMGLNLPIKNIYFTTASKWNGSEEVSIGTGLTKQIAGRAGRFGHHETGHVGAFDKLTLKYLQSTMPKQVTRLLFPLRYSLTGSIAIKIKEFLETDLLSPVIHFFQQHLNLNDWSIPDALPDQGYLASVLDKSSLDFTSKFILSCAPAIHNKYILNMFNWGIDAISKNEPLNLPSRYSKTGFALDDLEQLVKELTLYCWMHYRFENIFPELDKAIDLLKYYSLMINEKLASSYHRKCNQCGCKLAWDYQHGICQKCFNSRRRRYWYDDDDD